MSGDTGSAGRLNPFTQLPEWVAYSSVSIPAKFLYWVLATHINTLRAAEGDRRVWPSRATLAAHLGKSVRSVDGYLKELEVLGAIEVVKRKKPDGSNYTNHYVVYELPPEGYRGAKTVGEANDRLSHEKGTKRDEETVSAAQHGAQPTAPPRAAHCTRGAQPTAPELYEGELDEEEQTTTGYESRTILISAEAFPLTDEMRGRIAEHLGHLELDDENMEIQHNRWVLRHAGKTFTEDDAMDLWWGWMGRARRRCTDPSQLALEGADLVAAEKRWPDIDVLHENDLFIEKAQEEGLHFPSKQGWYRAWAAHMQEAQDWAVEDAA